MVLAVAAGVIGGAAVLSHLLRRRPRRNTTPDAPEVAPEDRLPAEQWRRVLFEEASLAYIELDREGLIVRSNRYASKVLGYYAAELVGKDCTQLVPEPERDKYRDEMHRKLCGEAEPIPYERRFLRKDGTLIPLEVHEAALRDRVGVLTGLLWAASDSSERQQKAEEAFQSTSELKALFQAMPDLFFRIDASGKILDFEAGQSARSFSPRGNPLGKPISEALTPEAGQQIAQAVSQIRENSSMAVIEYSAPGDQQAMYFEARLVPFAWDEIIVMVRNITERKRAEEKLEQFAQELQWKNEELATALVKAREATEIKDHFLSDMGHQIHTPMSGVLGMLDLLLGTGLDPDQEECAEAVRRCADSLLRLLDNVLSLSQAAGARTESAPFEPASVFRQKCEAWSAQARAKGLEFRFMIAGDLESTVLGDARRLGQVVMNLLDNAVKYTDRGSVELRAEVDVAPPGKLALRCEVRDTGRGIAREQQARLFDAVGAGRGLGLAISRQLAALLGGELTYTTEQGRGSTFRFTAVLDRAESSASCWRDLRVLVACVDPTSASLLRQHVESWGATAEIAASSALALPTLDRAARKGSPFHLALVDVDNPELNPASLARSVDADPHLTSTKLIWMASSLRDDLAALRDTGSAGFLYKPVLPSQLRDVISELVHPAGVKPHAAEAPVVAHDRPKAGPERPRVLLAEDNEVNQRIALRYLSRAGMDADVVSNGRDAVEAALSRHYDLILMDCLMPEMDGFDATIQIRRREGAAKRTPICAMTALTMDGSRERCLSAGMDSYLSKPFSATEFHNAIHRLVGAAPLRAEARNLAGALAPKL